MLCESFHILNISIMKSFLRRSKSELLDHIKSFWIVFLLLDELLFSIFFLFFRSLYIHDSNVSLDLLLFLIKHLLTLYEFFLILICFFSSLNSLLNVFNSSPDNFSFLFLHNSNSFFDIKFNCIFLCIFSSQYKLFISSNFS